MTMFGNKVFKYSLFKMRSSLRCTLIQHDQCPQIEDKFEHRDRHAYRENAMRRLKLWLATNQGMNRNQQSPGTDPSLLTTETT